MFANAYDEPLGGLKVPWSHQIMETLLSRCLMALLLAVFTSGLLAAQDEEEDRFAQGLIGKYQSAGGVVCERRDDAVAFAWRDRVPDRRLPAGNFRVEWRGFLLSQAPGEYQLHAHFSGKLHLELNGRVVLDAEAAKPAWHSSKPIDLEYDFHRLVVTFEKTNPNAAVGLFWSGPQFSREPIDGRQFFHDRKESPPRRFERGEQLARALRCAACHEIAGETEPLLAPALDRLGGQMHKSWLIGWLTTRANASADPKSELARRMPHMHLTEHQALAIATFLLDRPALKASPANTAMRASELSKLNGLPPPEKKDDKKKKKDAESEPLPKSPVEAGRELLLTLGCLACHRLDDLGASSLFDGGDLTHIAAKRPAAFLAKWLESPASINARHRMPTFPLADKEREQLAAFLATLGVSTAQKSVPDDPPALIAEGRALFREFRCAACHAAPEKESTNSQVARTKINAQSNWARGCVAKAGRDKQPQFVVNDEDAASLREFLTSVQPRGQGVVSAKQQFAERQCLACHQRGGTPGLAAQLPDVAARHPDLAPRIPAMTPPPLTSVGDKLQDLFLTAAIHRDGLAHRPYLAVRMPRFPLDDKSLQSLVQLLIDEDRIPDDEQGNRVTISPQPATIPHEQLLHAVGRRLVTPDGFGCTSCHQIGSVLPVKAPLNARGPDLSMCGERLRRTWFDRWVRNPARIVPRMEMPSVQVAVKGVLDESVERQLSAVWDVLNLPGFQPPEPNPVRVVRHTGTRPNDFAHVVTDVLRAPTGNLVKPLLIGLSNRHNVLFDLAEARFASWSAGDTARQRTEGKTWFWEAGGQELLRGASDLPEISLPRDGVDDAPQLAGQFFTEFDSMDHLGNGVRVRYRLHFDNERQLDIAQTFAPSASGFRRTIEIERLQAGERVRLVTLASDKFSEGKLRAGQRLWERSGPSSISIAVREPENATMQPNGIFAARSPENDGPLRFVLEYSTTFPVDQFPDLSVMPPQLQPEAVHVVPGFEATRLPLTDEIMPTALAWRPDGTLVIASLKGQVWQAGDTDGDGLADQLSPLSDDLAAPYGLFATGEYVDVVTKSALVRLLDEDHDGRAERTITIASGWGHTADYHDWVVGLPRDESGNYFVAVPCQQDDRSAVAANWRGRFLKLVPRSATANDPRPFRVEEISRGHRFPMGLARRRDGELFVTDNQGNYNPFNELNHVRRGAHFGFINAIERSNNERPPLTPPAINIPHPWVRSVNGICFLELPLGHDSKAPDAKPNSRHVDTVPHAFGPFAGHLIGCEYDTRRLVRMSLQKVGDTFQGAIYPFSFDQPAQGPPLLGPICCAISPTGELFIGSLRDSGWGGANNIGEVVRLRMLADQIPCGIAEMRATTDGFELEFTQPVERNLANNPANYSLASYTRESTPAYGGPDAERRTENIAAAELSADSRRVTLRLAAVRPGFVYELHVKPLVPSGQLFFPAEAHFSVLQK